MNRENNNKFNENVGKHSKKQSTKKNKTQKKNVNKKNKDNDKIYLRLERVNNNYNYDSKNILATEIGAIYKYRIWNGK